MENNFTQHLLLLKKNKNSHFYKVEIPISINQKQENINLIQVFSRNQIKQDLVLNKFYFQEEHCKLLENPEQYFFVIKELSEENGEVFIAVLYNQNSSFQILNHDITFFPTQQLLFFHYQNQSKSFYIWDEEVDEKQFRINLDQMVYSSNKNLPFKSRDNITLAKYGSNQILASSIQTQKSQTLIVLAVSRVEDEFEGQYEIIQSNMILDPSFTKIKLQNSFVFENFLLIFAKYQSQEMQKNGKFKNKQMAFVVQLKDANNLVCQAEINCLINMNDDYKICKHSQPKLFEVGEFIVARVQCKKRELISQSQPEEKQNKDEDENIDDEENLNSSGDFGDKSYGIESGDELLNNDENEHELLNANEKKPEIVNREWWFADLYFTRKLLMNKEEHFCEETVYFQVQHPKIQ